MNNPMTKRLRIVSLGLLVLITVTGAAITIETLRRNEPPVPPVVQTPAKTQPTSPFTFAAAGDFAMTANTDLVLRKISESKTDFTLALGDLGYGGNGTEPAWCDFVRQRVGDAYPFELVAGNHDDGTGDGNIVEYKKCLPDKIGSLVGEYGTEYYFDRGNLARIIAISPDINTVGAAYAKGSPHYAWVASVIDDARAAGLKWIILGMHKNCINIESKSCEIGEDLLNLAIEKKVELILQGHQHGYSRSKQLALSAECSAVVAHTVIPGCIADSGSDLSKGAGSVIVTAGTGGVDLRDVNLNDSEIEYFETWNGRNVGKSHGFSKFTLGDTTLVGEFVAVNGEFVDRFTLTVR
jgi:predicted MPP superfamily phosphohydrolase